MWRWRWDLGLTLLEEKLVHFFVGRHSYVSWLFRQSRMIDEWRWESVSGLLQRDVILRHYELLDRRRKRKRYGATVRTEQPIGQN